MGKLNITGKAERECAYDQVNITIGFKAFADASNDALKSVLQECEKFLGIIEQQGIELNDIKIGQDIVEQKLKDTKVVVTATREITLRVPFDMSFINYLSQVLAEKSSNIEFRTYYSLSNIKDIHEELLKEAIEDSKRKANNIVSMVGQKIVGIDTIRIERFGDAYSNCNAAIILRESNGTPPWLERSNKLVAETTMERESVEVVWLIE